jgi:hypothetical protein
LISDKARTNIHATATPLPTNLGFFSLEYQAVGWVVGYLVSVQYLDQLPTFHPILAKNLLDLSVEIGTRHDLDAVNLILKLSQFEPPLGDDDRFEKSVLTRRLLYLYRKILSLPAPIPKPIKREYDVCFWLKLCGRQVGDMQA